MNISDLVTAITNRHQESGITLLGPASREQIKAFEIACGFPFLMILKHFTLCAMSFPAMNIFSTSFLWMRYYCPHTMLENGFISQSI
jgi:hypothetical protein